MSHGDHKSHKAVVDLVKEYNKLNRNNVAIMLDTKGPEVRSGDVTEPIDMKPGSSIIPSCTNCSASQQSSMDCKLQDGTVCWQLPFSTVQRPRHMLLHCKP